MKNARIKAIFLLLCFALMMTASASPALGVESGDWIEYDFQETLSAVQGQWETVEFLNVVGMNVTIRVAVHLSSTMETNRTWTISMSSDDNFPDTVYFGVRVYIIPSNLETGASVYLGEFGNQTIAGETSGAVAGANRRLVYVNFSKKDGSLCAFYWDKQTGVLVQGTMSFGPASKAVLATETNMWSGDFVWWPWVIVIIIIVCSIVLSRKRISQKLRKKPNASSHRLG